MPKAKKMTLYKIKYYFVGLTICFCHFISFGQQSKIDSLQNLLQTAKDDTTCLRLFLYLGEICEIKDNLKYPLRCICNAAGECPVKCVKVMSAYLRKGV